MVWKQLDTLLNTPSPLWLVSHIIALSSTDDGLTPTARLVGSGMMSGNGSLRQWDIKSIVCFMGEGVKLGREKGVDGMNSSYLFPWRTLVISWCGGKFDAQWREYPCLITLGRLPPKIKGQSSNDAVNSHVQIHTKQWIRTPSQFLS